jgi:hypothetical protein
MKRIFQTLCVCLAAAVFAAGASSASDEKTSAIKPAVESKPIIQMAILLDTSGSMNGLIDQAKSQLWKVVNEFATTKKNGVRPELQVALYEYGKDSLPAAENYLRMIVPLSTDLDKVSEELFKLTTNGGEEYCGAVIKAATEQLQWSKSNDDLKVVFICGNEPFTQGGISYSDACKAAISKGIIVNTIFCGNSAEGVNTKWQDGAMLADGKFVSIDQNQQVVAIEAPQDKEIATLGVELNKTYIAFGAQGGAARERQSEQDNNAMAAKQGAAVQRALCKSSAAYDNKAWDLVDAAKDAPGKVAQLKEEELPAEMKKMNVEERKAFVAGKSADREKLQKQIVELNDARTKYVTEEMKKRSASSNNTLDAAVISAVKEQCAKRNYEVK